MMLIAFVRMLVMMHVRVIAIGECGRPAQMFQRALQVAVHPRQLLDRRSQVLDHVIGAGRARARSIHAR